MGKYKINYTGNYPIHAKVGKNQIILNGGEREIEVDELPTDMTWVEVLEPKASKGRKTSKKKVK